MMNKFGTTTTSSITLFLFFTHYSVLHSFGLGKSANDIQTDHLPPNPPNSGSLLLDWTITSPVQQSILASNTNLRNCKPLHAATNAFNRKINKYKDLLQLQPLGNKFLPLAIESLGGTHPEVRNFL
jgi:hypothetical protein